MSRADVVALIDFYESRGWDWRLALEFTVRRTSGSLPWQERKRR